MSGSKQITIVEAAEILGVSYSAAVQASRRYGWQKMNAGRGPKGGRPRITYSLAEVEKYQNGRNRQTFRPRKANDSLLQAVQEAAKNRKPIGRIAKELGVSHFLIGSAAYELIARGKKY
jgi:hypothetical protein